MSTLKSALGFWLTFVKAMGLSIAITFASGLIGVVYGGLFFPFDVTEEAFANRLADGTTAAFLLIMTITLKRRLRFVPGGFARIERFLPTSVVLAWALDRHYWDNQALIYELVPISSVLLLVVLTRPQSRTGAVP